MSLAKWFCKNSKSTAMVEDEGFADFMALASTPVFVPCFLINIKKVIIGG